MFKADGGGLRYNEGKNRLELIPPEVIFALGDVLTHGSKKYAARNWERGMKWSNVVSSLLRHIYKWLAGEKLDKESGLPHLAHVLTNAAFLLTYEARNVGENDIPAFQTEDTEV